MANVSRPVSNRPSSGKTGTQSPLSRVSSALTSRAQLITKLDMCAPPLSPYHARVPGDRSSNGLAAQGARTARLPRRVGLLVTPRDAEAVKPPPDPVLESQEKLLSVKGD